MKETKSCCRPEKRDKPEGFWPGLIYGLLPHSFCIAFVIFSIVGATTATTIFRKFLILPYFLHLLIGLSFVFATLSALFYLKRNDCLSNEGIKVKWQYLLILYGTTVGINLAMFTVILPAMANFKSEPRKMTLASTGLTKATLKVAIPCPGHSPLITEELKKIPGVEEVFFRLPNYFEIGFDSQKTTLEKILGVEVFRTYRPEII
jgi:hypothetical protein